MQLIYTLNDGYNKRCRTNHTMQAQQWRRKKPAAVEHKFWLTPTDRARCCVTPSRHRVVHKAGRWVWSTGDSRRSTVDNTWRRSTCCRETILSSEVGEKLHREFRLFLDIFEFCICLINIPSFREELSPIPGALVQFSWSFLYNNFPCLRWHVSDIRLVKMKKISGKT